MVLHGIRVLEGRRFQSCTTDSHHDLPIAPNLLTQQFSTALPNKVWLADITYLSTGEGWLYLAAVLDLATRKIVGMIHARAHADRIDVGYPNDDRLTAATRDLVCHSGCGSQYAAEIFRQQLASMKATLFMSRTGCCYDCEFTVLLGEPDPCYD